MRDHLPQGVGDTDDLAGERLATVGSAAKGAVGCLREDIAALIVGTQAVLVEGELTLTKINGRRDFIGARQIRTEQAAAEQDQGGGVADAGEPAGTGIRQGLNFRDSIRGAYGLAKRNPL